MSSPSYLDFAAASPDALVDGVMSTIHDEGNSWWGTCHAFLDAVVCALVWKRDHAGMRLDVAVVAAHLRLERYLELASDPRLPDELREALRRPVRLLHGYSEDNGFFQNVHVCERFAYVAMVLTSALEGA